ncbi:MAG TPA: methionyl-tRNA formyltransferase, partial [Megamonas hypermegale]|nr:methionyl-tRNA formyltransferase [Megamonas hypermegale]
QGADLLIETIQSIENGTVSREKQDDSLSCYAKMLNNDNCRIDWTKSAQEIHDLVRGLNSWPIAYTTLNGKKFKIWQTKIIDTDTTGKTPGQIIDLTKKGIIVATGNGTIELLQIQPPNKAKMPASSYINGHRQELSSDISFI